MEIKKIKFKDFYCRTCTYCKNGMNEGFCINDGDEYYCSSKCLDTRMTQEEFYEMYEDDCAYWTEWDKKDEYDLYLEELGEYLSEMKVS